jgi:hypothetical protein
LQIGRPESSQQHSFFFGLQGFLRLNKLAWLRMTLGNLIFTTADFLLVNYIWLHVNVSGSLWSDFGSISPKRNEPKKATQQANQNTSLLSWDQLLLAISWPIIFSRGKGITNFEFFVMEKRNIFLAPFNIALMKKSFSNFASTFLIL